MIPHFEYSLWKLFVEERRSRHGVDELLCAVGEWSGIKTTACEQRREKNAFNMLTGSEIYLEIFVAVHVESVQLG